MNPKRLLAAFLTSCTLTAALPAQCPDFDLRFGTARVDDVRALVTFDAGSGPRLIAGGNFSGLLEWDGSNWTSVASAPDGPVLAMRLHDFGSGPVLVVAGEFMHAGGVPAERIATWNGTTWTALGSGLDGTVEALGAYDSGSGTRLVAGGAFVNSGAVPTSHLASFDGANWSEIGGGLDGEAYALTVFDDGLGPRLFVGGQFTLAGSTVCSNIASWNGTSWNSVGGGTDQDVQALLVTNGPGGSTLIAGGGFQQAGSTAASLVARFDGTQWSAVGSGLGTFSGFGRVRTLLQDGLGFVAGGVFQTMSANPTNLVARWDGTQWLDMGLGLGSISFLGISAFARHDPADGGGPRLFAGGNILSGNGHTRSVVQWNGTTWSGTREVNAQGIFAQPSDSGAAAVTGWQGDLVVVGGFDSAGELLTANGVARFDGERWHAMGSAPVLASADQPVHVEAIEFNGVPELVMGVMRNLTVSDTSVPLYRWNGASWTPFAGGTLPLGPSAMVQDVHVFDDGGGSKLYAGGIGLMAQGSSVSDSVVRWDGTAWTRLGTSATPGVSGLVLALKDYDDGSGSALYACGQITGGVQRWDGSAWTVVGSGMSGDVVDLQAFDDGSGMKLYASGSFLQAGGVNVNGMARWNGTTWEPCPGVGPIFMGMLSLDVFDDRSGSGPRLYGANFSDDLMVFDGSGWSVVAITDPYFTFGRATVVNDAPGGRALVMHGNFDEVFELGQPANQQAGLALFRACAGVTSFCTGDGLDPALTVACPCANNGAAGHGCAWDVASSGGRLGFSGAPDSNDLVLLADSLPIGGFSLFFQGGSAITSGTVFGDGLRCASTPIVRLAVKANPSGIARVPDVSDPALSILGGATPGDSITRSYQVWFRAAGTFCTSATFNLTNALKVSW